MEFCTITPIEGMQRWGTALSNRHLILAQMLYNEKYAHYYTTRRLSGDFIILDNGAYELTNPIDAPAFMNMVKNIHPQVAVLPDILGSPWKKTTAASLNFLDEYGDYIERLGYKTEWMFVPQIHGGKIEEIYKAVDTVLNDGRQGHRVTWIGLGRYLATKWGSRTVVAVFLKKMYPEIRLHALGMANGNLSEMKHLRDIGVESIDSSAPVWRGWLGMDLTSESDCNYWQEHGKPCNFHADAPQENNTKLIESNLEAIRVALGN